MAAKSLTKKYWTKPKLRKLGTIKDVSGTQGVGAQAGGFKT